MLGRDLARALDGREVTALGRAELDITDEAAVRRRRSGPRRRHQRGRLHPGRRRRGARGGGVRDQRDRCRPAGAPPRPRPARGSCRSRPTTCSTAPRRSPYPEDAPRDPQGAYGRTKAEGERLVLEAHPGPYLVRTAWLYGAHGPNFARTMLRLAGERETVERRRRSGRPADLDRSTSQRAIVRLLDADAPSGIYHGTNSGQASWFDFARAIFAVSGLDPERVLPIDSAAYPAPGPAPRLLGARPRRLATSGTRGATRLARGAFGGRRRGSAGRPVTTLRVIVDDIVAPPLGELAGYARALTREPHRDRPARIRSSRASSRRRPSPTTRRSRPSCRASAGSPRARSPATSCAPAGAAASSGSSAAGWCTRRACSPRSTVTTACTSRASSWS